VINLLPADIKSNRRFGNRNRLVIRYCFLVAMILVLLGGMYGFGYMSLTQTRRTVEQSVAQKSADIADLDTLNKKAQDLSDMISTAATLLNRETKFSDLITKIGGAMPEGAALTKLSLASDHTKPLEIQATLDNEAQASILQKNLIASGVFAAADIEEVHTELQSDQQPGGAATTTKVISTRILATFKQANTKPVTTKLPESFKP
jgi:Tfp pilus assembly protein PilN